VSNETSLWQGGEIAKLFQCEGFDVDLAGVSIDSRSVVPGDLFIALSGDPGPRFGGGEPGARDGHDFIDMAIRNGATAVMSHREVTCSVPVIPVADTLDGLWQLGKAARQRCQGSIVAITGSSGKTTIRGWLEKLLNTIAETHASEGSFNNHWGVPLSLARMPRTTQFGVFEVGTNHPGEIAPLANLVAPDVSLLLNVLPAHIGNFADLAALRQEKLAIASGNSTLILPVSLKSETDWPRTITFGNNSESDVRGALSAPGLLTAAVFDDVFEINVPWRDPERIDSVLAVLAVLKILDVDIAWLVGEIMNLVLPEGRGNYRLASGVLVIDDSYNANPASMAMALRNLANVEGEGRKIALLGEMLELGDETEASHEAMAALVTGLDQVITFGQGFDACGFGAAHHHLGNIDELDLGDFIDSLGAGDVVLIKGSNKVFWQKGFVKSLVTALDARS
jgi:UDP-N-acetylmuramoyl-tripeptide--D-alanyl-D-alanine ligase